MCESIGSTIFMHVSDCSKTQKMCDGAVDKDSKMLKCVPDCFKTHEMCKKADSKLFTENYLVYSPL